jgi:hypothetical protein
MGQNLLKPIQDRIAETIPPQLALHQYSDEVDRACHLELIKNDKLIPFNVWVEVGDARLASFYLKDVEKLSEKRRVTAERVIEFYLSDEGYKSGVPKALRTLGIDKGEFDILVTDWKYFWPFTTMLVARKIHNSKHRVDSATLEAAINGTHQDRRLFYEVFGGLKKDEGRGGSTTLIFINDSMHRPQFESEARKAAAVLIEKVADLEQDSAPEAIEALTDL